MIAHGVDGLVLASESVDALADAIMGDEELRERTGAAARAQVAPDRLPTTSESD